MCEPALTVSSKTRVWPGGSCDGGKGKRTGKRLSGLLRKFAFASNPHSRRGLAVAAADGGAGGASCGSCADNPDGNDPAATARQSGSRPTTHPWRTRPCAMSDLQDRPAETAPQLSG